jgi:hypothetical protein
MSKKKNEKNKQKGLMQPLFIEPVTSLDKMQSGFLD